MFICPFSQLKVFAIADGEGLPQYKSIPEKCKSTDTNRAAFHKREAAFFRFFTESWGKSSLGARLRTRKVTGRDASLPAPLLAASLGLVGRGTVGALPQTPQGTLSLDPARGRRKGTKSPLDPFSRLSWSRFHAPSACSFLVLRLSLCLLPQFSVKNRKRHSPIRGFTAQEKGAIRPASAALRAGGCRAKQSPCGVAFPANTRDGTNAR